jgi:phenylpropionate dioxygenase-like ring-hydroxylating dioxygenase large terminal subunit
MRLLGENLVMYRDSLGRIGAYPEACPHRGASLYFGRNEECGLRCNYHGWKFDVDGNCVDVPTETNPGFKDHIRIRNYPCREVNHLVWIYMGPRSTPPAFPGYEVNTLPASHVREPLMMMYEANWLQNIEGAIDSAHLDFLHRRLRDDSPDPPIGQPGFWNPDPNPPRVDVRDAEYGGYYTTVRTLPDGQDWHRVTHFLMPFFTMVSAPWARLRAWVPMDDYHTLVFSQYADPVEPFDPARLENTPEEEFAEVGGWVDRSVDNNPLNYYLTRANQTNDYLLDYDVQRTLMSSGIPFVLNLQDRAMTEQMRAGNGEPLYDRTQEHLGRTDLMVVAVRRKMLDAVRAHEDSGEVPPNVDNDELNLVRPVTMVLPKGADWDAETEEARKVHPGESVLMQRGTVQDKDGNNTDARFMVKSTAGTSALRP